MIAYKHSMEVRCIEGGKILSITQHGLMKAVGGYCGRRAFAIYLSGYLPRVPGWHRKRTLTSEHYTRRNT